MVCILRHVRPFPDIDVTAVEEPDPWRASTAARISAFEEGVILFVVYSVKLSPLTEASKRVVVIAVVVVAFPTVRFPRIISTY